MFYKFYKRIVIGELMAIKNGTERQFDMTVPRLIAKEEKKCVAGVWLRMVFSVLVTGCTFKEYYNLNFIKRTLSNQKTFITTGSNINAYLELNDKSLNRVYLNKDEFNEKYAEFIGREWIKLSQNKEEIYSFFARHNDIIIKPRDGDSGKGIVVLHGCRNFDTSQIDELIRDTESGIAEQLLYNHPKLNELNESSLNTMRIITVRNGDKLDILFAGIRFGAKGSEIDNISTGGRIAPIDISTGMICDRTHVKKSIVSDDEQTDYIGFEIPMWDALEEYLYRLTAVVPQMRYMAWDIAVTEQGFAVIEGNHSSGNTVTQAHLGVTQQGLRVRLNELMDQMKR